MFFFLYRFRVLFYEHVKILRLCLDLEFIWGLKKENENDKEIKEKILIFLFTFSFPLLNLSPIPSQIYDSSADQVK